MPQIIPPGHCSPLILSAEDTLYVCHSSGNWLSNLVFAVICVGVAWHGFGSGFERLPVKRPSIAQKAEGRLHAVEAYCGPIYRYALRNVQTGGGASGHGQCRSIRLGTDQGLSVRTKPGRTFLTFFQKTLAPFAAESVLLQICAQFEGPLQKMMVPCTLPCTDPPIHVQAKSHVAAAQPKDQVAHQPQGHASTAMSTVSANTHTHTHKHKGSMLHLIASHANQTC